MTDRNVAPADARVGDMVTFAAAIDDLDAETVVFAGWSYGREILDDATIVRPPSGVPTDEGTLLAFYTNPAVVELARMDGAWVGYDGEMDEQRVSARFADGVFVPWDGPR